jgi:hypothetical protein
MDNEDIKQLATDLNNVISATEKRYINQIASLKADIVRLNKRDLNASIVLCYDDGKDPFAREKLIVVDVSVSDNIYVVESQVVKELKSKYDALKASHESLKTACNNFKKFANTDLTREEFLSIPDSFMDKLKAYWGEIEQALAQAEEVKE